MANEHGFSGRQKRPPVAVAVPNTFLLPHAFSAILSPVPKSTRQFADFRGGGERRPPLFFEAVITKTTKADSVIHYESTKLVDINVP